jgi:coproporphyrinogen III oxidase
MSSKIRPFLRPSSLQKFRLRFSQQLPSRRTLADYPKPPKPNDAAPKGVLAPKTRIAFGIVFIGAMIYSMVSYTTFR